MDWQKVLLYDMMAVDDDGLWVHSKFGLSVPRRNGKSEIDKMRELWGLFHGEHILHTAHRTAKHSAWIFTNVSLTGEDSPRSSLSFRSSKFLSTSPLRGTTLHLFPLSTTAIYFYPRPPCGGRPSRSVTVNPE